MHILFPGSRLFCCVCRCCLLNPIENSASCTSCTAVFTLSCPHWRLQCIQSLAGTQQACLRLGSFGFDLVVFFPLSFSSSLSFCSSSSRHSVACLLFGLSVCLCLLIKIQRRHNGSRPMLWCCCRCCCCWLMADAVAAGAVSQTNFHPLRQQPPFSPFLPHLIACQINHLSAENYFSCFLLHCCFLLPLNHARQTLTFSFFFLLLCFLEKIRWNRHAN